MGLFDFLKNKPAQEPQKDATEAVVKVPFYQSTLKVDTADWNQVVSACMGRITANQLACADYVVRGRNWNVDFTRGIIAFGQEEYPLQFIGSESSSSGTWLWGWENINGFGADILQTANFVKELGEQWQLPELMVPGCNLDDGHNGHLFSMVACGMSPQNLCYYRGPHDGGAIFVAFPVTDGRVFAGVDAKTFADITLQSISQFALDHRLFVEGFLLQNNTPYEWNGDVITAHFAKDITIAFEQVGDKYRIKKIGGIA